MAARLQEVLCTIHNLKFAYDADRVRELGHEPALMRCPLCARADEIEVHTELKLAVEHRDLLLKAIDLKKLVTRVR